MNSEQSERAIAGAYGSGVATGDCLHRAGSCLSRHGAINDFANVLSAETESSLSALVENIEQGTTAEIAVATVCVLGRHHD